MPPRKRDWTDDPRNPAAAALRRAGGKNIVQNKNAADLQMTAEQLILDSYELHQRQAQATAKQPDLVLISREELLAHQQAKRQKLDEIARRDSSRLGPWMAYAAWEERQGDVQRMRDVYERCLHFLAGRADVWITYAKAEARVGSPLLARAVLQRATKALPAEHALWLHALLLERCLGTPESVRELFGQWLSFRPGDAVWREWARFEIATATSDNSNNKEENDDGGRRFERARSVLARYVSEHNTADAWLFYAACERELMGGNARQAVKVLRTALQAIPETEQSREGAARLALATARALEATGDDAAARAVYTKLLDEFFGGGSADDDLRGQDEDADADDNNERAQKLHEQRAFRDQFRDAVCDALVALEKRCGTAQAAAAVEERKRRWELQGAIAHSGGANFAAQLELLQLERAALRQLQHAGGGGDRAVNAGERVLSDVAALYERVCFPSVEQIVHMELLRHTGGAASPSNSNNNSSAAAVAAEAQSSATNVLDELSIAWESFAFFCEQEVQSPVAAVDIFRRAVSLLESMSASSSGGAERGASVAPSIDLLCGVIEQTALVHLRALNVAKFRMCMQLASRLAATASGASVANSSSSSSSSNDSLFFAVLRRWAELEEEVGGAAALSVVLRHGLEFRQCRQRAAVWHSLADTVGEQCGDTASDQVAAVLEEALATLLDFYGLQRQQGGGEGEGGEDEDDADALVRFLEMHESVPVAEAEADIDSVWLRLFQLRLSSAAAGRHRSGGIGVAACRSMIEQRLERHVQAYVAACSQQKRHADALAAAAAPAASSSAAVTASSATAAARRQRLAELVASLSDVVRADLSMLERFLFATCDDAPASAVDAARRAYRACTTDVRRRCGEQATKGIVALWKKFEDAHGDTESRRAMDRTANAVATRVSRLFQRAHQAETKYTRLAF